MKVGISSDLMDHYAGSMKTTAMFWKATRKDDEVFGFTTHDKNITYDGIEYLARTGMNPSVHEGQTKLAPDNMESVGLLDDDRLTEEDLLAGIWDYAQIEVFALNWEDLYMGADTILSGRLGEIQSEDGVFTAELRGLSAAYNTIPRKLYQATCRTTLGTAQCGIVIAGWTVTGTLTSVSDNGRVLYDTARTEPGPSGGKAITSVSKSTSPVVGCPAHGFQEGQIVYIAGISGMVELNGFHYIVGGIINANSYRLVGVDTTEFTTYLSGGTATPQGDSGYFDYGNITMTSGASVGLSMEVKSYSPGSITLQIQMPRGAEAGDTYSMSVGCGRRFLEDCVGRFSNGPRFRGEPFVPGLDRLTRVGGM